MQIAQHADRREAVTGQTDIERENPQNVLTKINIFQTRLSYDFLGTAG